MPVNVPEPHTLIVIAGPTAVGKTRFAIQLAKKLETVILSSDSRQFYREMNIGTAKPSADELAAVTHYFIGHLSIHDYYNISRFESDCIRILEEEFCRKRSVILTGGSGLYIDAVCKGVDDFPDADPELRSFLKGILQDEGIGKLQHMLKEHDPQYYNQVDLANPVRLIRALEVCLATGKTYSAQRQNLPCSRDFNVIKIGLDLPRAKLFERIHTRVDEMMLNGLLDEVKMLLPFRHLNALNTVGYKELFEYLDGKVSLDQAVENIRTHTRRYAKRQLTWFRKDPEYNWFEPDQVDQVAALISSKKEA